MSKNDLFLLIKSLTKQEKRYFKLHSSLHTIGESNNYVRLFDAIEGQKIYDEKEIKQRFKNETFVKQLSVIKNRLREAVLKSLNAYYSGASIDDRIRNKLHSVEILFQKGLFKECLAMLDTIKEIARLHEKDKALLEILQWERLIKGRYQPPTDEKDAIEIAEEEKAILKRILNLSNFQNIAFSFRILYNKIDYARSGSIHKEMEMLMTNPLLQDESSADSTHTKYFFYQLNGLYHELKEDHKRFYEYTSKTLNLLDNKPYFYEQDPTMYVSSLYNAAYSTLLTRRYNETFSILKKLKTGRFSEIHREDVKIKVFTFYHQLLLLLYNQTGEFVKSTHSFSSIEKGILEFGNKLPNRNKIMLRYHMAYAYLGQGKIKEVLPILNRIFNENHVEHFMELHCYARLLNLIVHIELQNYETIPYLIKSARRFLNKKNHLYQVENIVLKYAENISNAGSPADVKHIYREFHKKLLELNESAVNRRAFYLYFDFLSWVESKISNEAFGDIVKEKARKSGLALVGLR